MDYDVIIIGGGPAGLTAAIYTSRARLKTLVIESYSVPGQAIITDSIENFPGFPEGINGFELVEKFKKQAEKFGAELIVKNVEKIEQLQDGWRIKAEDKTYTTLSIIIATGAHPRKLDVPGEHKFTGKGVSYCATCDGALYRDKHVVVIGGGDTAIDEALFLTRFAKKVTLVHRRDRLRATKILQERVLANKKIEFAWESNVIEILGKDKVGGVKIKNIKTPVKIRISGERVDSKDEFLYHKTTRRAFYERERSQGLAKGYFETIFLNQKGELTEGVISNLFILKDKIIYTPLIKSGLLPGVLREYLIKKGKVKEKILYLKDFKSADKIYIGNSVRGLCLARPKHF